MLALQLTLHLTGEALSSYCEIVGKNVDLQTTNAWILHGAGSRQLIYDFLLVINTNLPPILHHFQDIAFDRSKSAIFGYPSCI